MRETRWFDKGVRIPDITMCNNRDCPSRKTCYRYRAKPDKYQSYSTYLCGMDGKCGEFWDCSDYIAPNLRTLEEIESKCPIEDIYSE